MRQRVITRAELEQLATLRPRRHRLAEWKALRVPQVPGKDPSLSFPFRESFENLLLECPIKGLQLRDGKGAHVYVYLRCDGAGLQQVERWLDSMAPYVVCRDLLAVSLALDYDREQGGPTRDRTGAGALRKQAKPYDGPVTGEHYAAASHLAGAMITALETVSVYRHAEVVVPMPPSSPAKEYDLASLLAGHVAARWGRIDGRCAIRTTRARPELKSLAVSEKLAALEGTFEIDRAVVAGRVVLLVDDLYQSGLSMNFVAMKLQEAGARAILGLAAEKTVRNDDNQVRR